METLDHIFRLLAGIGLFLFAMYLLEESIKNLSGRSFKLFLQRITKNKIGAISGGAIVTAVLQSSSMVSFMVLAFVGAGVFTMKNAMGIILGANLGTTLNSWLVATLGFKMDIEIVAYPALCMGGLLLILFGSRKTFKYLSFFLFGFGLLFIGLAFMRTAMEAQVKIFDFSKYAEMPLIVFLLIGFIITMLVQSSSVTMALTLSALHVGAISFPIAAATVLGSETGTTIKIVLGAIGGNASKKRVALGNFLFNVFITLFAFILLKPILYLITDIFNIKDSLIGLVTFSSLINLFSIIIFLPILDYFTQFLERFFKDTDGTITAFIGNATAAEPLTALDLFRRETNYFIHNSMLFNLELFKIDSQKIQGNLDFKTINEKRKYFTKSTVEKYDFLKQLQGELQAFYLNLRPKLESKQYSELNQLISAVRSSMHSVKSIKDIGTNISDLRNSSKEIKYNFFIHHKKETETLYLQLDALLTLEKEASFKNLQSLFDSIQQNYTEALNNFYAEAQNAPIQNIDITTVINFNRELFTSNKAMLIALKDFLLKEKQAQEFNEIPTYKT
ncbi:Na/Pi cotransporter family protein [Flavobacterium granuli]|uniref:Phosphate:Na+ symporter n=1 Tax=Flavobacterium granuli TaxID=280093 RepID=A0A1M5RBZ7_9FLAO|nr:Na/Pi symporter [Flavobacterium granuli]PRZ21690.1 phosphate:Na+ symporter [Flavobacterium granuli]SHH23864.1 phosphate:Na+ symporter [Flavobacterium granuli]